MSHVGGVQTPGTDPPSGWRLYNGEPTPGADPGRGRGWVNPGMGAGEPDPMAGFPQLGNNSSRRCAIRQAHLLLAFRSAFLECGHPRYQHIHKSTTVTAFWVSSTRGAWGDGEKQVKTQMRLFNGHPGDCHAQAPKPIEDGRRNFHENATGKHGYVVVLLIMCYLKNWCEKERPNTFADKNNA